MQYHSSPILFTIYIDISFLHVQDNVISGTFKFTEIPNENGTNARIYILLDTEYVCFCSYLYIFSHYIIIF